MARKQRVIKHVVSAGKESGKKIRGKRIRKAISTPGTTESEQKLYRRAGRIAASNTTAKEGKGVTKFLRNADKRVTAKAGQAAVSSSRKGKSRKKA